MLLLGLVLQLVGFERHAPRVEQTEIALMTIRVLTSLAPMTFLLLAVFVTTRYPLTRKAHSEILDQLRDRVSDPAQRSASPAKLTRSPGSMARSPSAEAGQPGALS